MAKEGNKNENRKDEKETTWPNAVTAIAVAREVFEKK
jgi:hypothetical protein